MSKRPWKTNGVPTGLATGRLLLLILTAVSGSLVWAQQPRSANSESQSYGSHDFVLGAGDLITVRALHVAEMPEKPIRISEDGYVRLPLAGKVKAAGLTLDQLSRAIELLLADSIREPEVFVDLAEAKSHPVSVIGAVKAPGVYQVQGEKRLLDILSAAGGMDADAGDLVRVSRPLNSGRIPYTSAHDIEGFSIAEISLPDLIEAKHPESNLVIQPGDVISIAKAKLVYVIGQVKRAGGFVLRDRESMSVLQAISMAEGMTPVAGAKNAKILRRGNDSADRQEIPVNVAEVLSGKTQDPKLLAGDILFVPDNVAKSATLRAVEAAIQMGTGIVIWRH